MTKKREPWNKGRAVGPRLAFTQDEVKAILASFSDDELHDKCLFMIAIDSMLRCSDLLRIKVADLQHHDLRMRDISRIRQCKTNNNVIFALSNSTKSTCSKWISKSKKHRRDLVFSNVGDRPFSSVWYRRKAKTWAGRIGLPTEGYSGHSLRRTKATWLYINGFEPEKIAILLGHRSTESTISYLSINSIEICSQAKNFDIF